MRIHMGCLTLGVLVLSMGSMSRCHATEPDPTSTEIRNLDLGTEGLYEIDDEAEALRTTLSPAEADELQKYLRDARVKMEDLYSQLPSLNAADTVKVLEEGLRGLANAHRSLPETSMRYAFFRALNLIKILREEEAAYPPIAGSTDVKKRLLERALQTGDSFYKIVGLDTAALNRAADPTKLTAAVVVDRLALTRDFTRYFYENANSVLNAQAQRKMLLAILSYAMVDLHLVSKTMPGIGTIAGTLHAALTRIAEKPFKTDAEAIMIVKELRKAYQDHFLRKIPEMDVAIIQIDKTLSAAEKAEMVKDARAQLPTSYHRGKGANSVYRDGDIVRYRSRVGGAGTPPGKNDPPAGVTITRTGTVTGAPGPGAGSFTVIIEGSGGTERVFSMDVIECVKCAGL